jgi:hypothetical protein
VVALCKRLVILEAPWVCASRDRLVVVEEHSILATFVLEVTTSSAAMTPLAPLLTGAGLACRLLFANQTEALLTLATIAMVPPISNAA